MNARDEILLVAVGPYGYYTSSGPLPEPHHLCTVLTQTSHEWHTREQLDPMALGTCRYCEQPLPGGDAA